MDVPDTLTERFELFRASGRFFKHNAQELFAEESWVQVLLGQGFEMRADPDVFFMGQDVGPFGGAMQGAAGLFEEFGARRVRETPISEAAMVGAAARHIGFTELTASELSADSAVAGDWAEAATWARRALEARTYETMLLGLSRWHETEALLRAGDADAATEDVRRYGEFADVVKQRTGL